MRDNNEETKKDDGNREYLQRKTGRYKERQSEKLSI